MYLFSYTKQQTDFLMKELGAKIDAGRWVVLFVNSAELWARSRIVWLQQNWFEN